MKIAIDVSPISSTSGHKVRGVGSYVRLLAENLEKYDNKNTYYFVENNSAFPKDVDRVHIPYFDPFHNSIPKVDSAKTIVTIHDLIPVKFPEHFPSGIRGRMQWEIQKVRVRKTRSIITDSLSSKNDIVTITGNTAQKVHVVYLAADPTYKVLPKKNLNPISEQIKILPEKFFLYVGDATWNKNIVRIITAVGKTTIPLVMVGKVFEQKEISNNPWTLELRQAMELIEGNKQFILPGYLPIEDVLYLYNRAVGLVMPSLYEGFGLPILEAMQSGCPVITAKSGSIAEVAGDSVCYVDPLNSESIIDGLKSILENKKMRQELIDKGLKRSQQFSVEKTIQETILIYEQV
jgi:glycosyltransferase involved in cell wall biosynthesis